MSVNIHQRSATIGSFIQTIGTRNCRYLNFINYKVTLKPTLSLQKKTSNYFSCCPWNANSILGHNKISLLTAYHTVRRFNIICISETYLDSTVDDKTIEITGYNLIRAG